MQQKTSVLLQRCDQSDRIEAGGQANRKRMIVNETKHPDSLSLLFMEAHLCMQHKDQILVCHIAAVTIWAILKSHFPRACLPKG